MGDSTVTHLFYKETAIRIISKFKDYYDVVAGQGVDLTRIYSRNTTEYVGGLPLKGWEERRSWRDELSYSDYPKFSDCWRLRGQGLANPANEIGYVYVVFAGKLYGGLRFFDGIKSKTIWIWDEQTLDAVRKEYNLWGEEPYISKYQRNRKPKLTKYEVCKKILSIRGDEVLREWAVDRGFSIVVDGNHLLSAPSYYHPRGQKIVISDPVLKDIEFQKVLHPFTAYQELEQWIYGVLGQNPQPLEVSDAVKIQQHGFDRWSFRKHKLDNVK